MSYRKRSANLVLILVVLSVLFMGARAKREKTAQFPALPSDAPRYASGGPHPVGTREILIEGETPLEGTVWYPASEVGDLEDAVSYKYEIKMVDPFGTVAFATFAGHAIQDARFELAKGPFPLVILSPGFSTGATTYAWLAEHVASYGFVVLAPEHQEHLDPENELWRAAIKRPQDILAVLSFVDRQVNPGGIFEGLIDKDVLAVIGHSYGGYTSLAVAGARMDTESLTAKCEHARESKHPGAWLCDQLLPHLADMADLEGLDSVPEALWPAWADPRVDAAVSMAGDAFFFGSAGLAEITVPVLAIGGTLDTDSPFEWGTHPTYEYVSSPRKVKIALEDGEHMIFTGPCERIPWYLRPFSGEFCSDPGWNRHYAHALIRHFTTAFLLVELKHDTDASAVLVNEAVNFPGVEYDARGY